jgi:hypothetical protein
MILGALGSLYGMRLLPNIHLTETKSRQTFFPRSKKWRIRKKCAKKYRIYYQVPSKEIFVAMGNTIIGHPETLRQLCQQLKD